MLRFDRAYSPQQEVREKCIEATRFARVPGGQWEGAMNRPGNPGD